MTEQQAMRLALEALERSVATCFDQYAHEQVMSRPEHFVNQAITALLQALEQQQDEPVARLKVADEPCNQVMALGQMMREWLQAQVSDAGTSVDVGKGFSEFDLWVQCEGKELFITIKEKND